MEFKLSMSRGFAIDDDFIEELAFAWPNICLLSLFTDWKLKRPVVTLKGLQTLAKHCHHLRYITLSINAQLLPGSDTPLEEPSNSIVEEVCLPASMISDGQAVADLMGNMFPKLRRFGKRRHMIEQERDKWGEVIEILHLEETKG
jgi:hypothetical protein